MFATITIDMADWSVSSPGAEAERVWPRDVPTQRWTLTADQVIHDLVSDASLAKGLKARYLTVLPQSVLRYNAKQWSLKALPIDLEMKPMSVTLITLKQRTLSPVVRLFAEQVRAIRKK